MAHILLVDDEPALLKILSDMLALEGHQTMAVVRGDAAMARIIGKSFDLAITDIRMNPIDGLQVLATARRLQPDMPVIMLTAYDSESARKRAAELGAYAFITKPFEPDELVSVVTGALESLDTAGGSHEQD
ncbi:MAG: response regulator [Kiritimatiellia bacterium]|jgi:DNA-binding response OmpR family regulator|nr:response regulator [Kiritimatiellia bacterium]